MGIRTSTCSEAQLLESYVNSSYDIIKKAVDNLDTITLLGDLNNDSESVVFLQSLLDNIDEITEVVNSTTLISAVSEDIAKGTYFGSRKLDIDLSLNKTGIEETTTSAAALDIWNTTATTVYYSSANATMANGDIIAIPFLDEALDPTLESTHNGIVTQLSNNTTFTTALENTSIATDIGGRVGSIIRITDSTGTISNLEKLELITSTGDSVDASPDYFWASTTSSLQVIADRIADIIAIGNDITDIITVGDNITEVVAVGNSVTELLTIYANLSEILLADDNAAAAAASETNAANSATSASNSANDAATYATNASNFADAANVAKIEWQGAWSSVTAYVLNDAVELSGASYICIQAHTNQIPTVSGNAYWDVLARAGLDGAGSGDLISTNNLSDVDNAATSLANLGGQPLNDALTDISTTGANTAADEFLVGTGVGTLAWESGATVRTSLGLGDSAVKNTGTGAGDVAAGDHTHTGVYEPADATILKEEDLAGTGVATTPAKSDHNHDSTYDAAGTAIAMTIALGG